MADYPGAHFLVGGRGHGKRAAQERELHAYLAAVEEDTPGEYTYTRRLNAPDEYTGNPPASVRRNVAAQLSITRTVMDELTRQALAMLDVLDPRPRVAELIAHSPRTAPPVTPAVGTVRWACVSPTGREPLDPLLEWGSGFTAGIVDGLSGRPRDILELLIEAKGKARRSWLERTH